VKIHPLALLSDDAVLGADVEIGPFCVVESGVRIGAHCRLDARVTIKHGTVLGEGNHVHEGAVLGGTAQHTRPPEVSGGLVIGCGNTIRENVTVHRALHDGHLTTIGDGNLLMVNVHIAHDCHVGSHTIFANNAMLAGHVSVEDRAYLSGAVAVHQFCRIGQFAMVGGQAHINRDIPPYVTIDGVSSHVVGLNIIGLKRYGFSEEDILQLKAAYRLIYRSAQRWEAMLEELRAAFPTGPAAAFHPFLTSGQRGFVQERRIPPAARLRLKSEEAEEITVRFKERQSRAG
jgi:UDP-N-acetylglucosamine acyltransferase